MDNDRQNSRMWIVEAATILFQTNKYDDISISNIIEKAGVSRRTFYNNFGSKLDLVEALLMEGFEEEMKSDILSADNLGDSIMKMIDVTYVHKNVVRNLRTESTSDMVSRLLKKIMEIFFHRYENEIDISEESRDEVYIEYMINVASSILDTVVDRNFQETKEEVYYLITNILNIHKK